MEKDFDYKNIEELDFEENELTNLKKIFDRKDFKSIYGELKPNKTIPLHTHEDNDQSAIILDGDGEYIAGGEKIKLSKGTSWYVKAGVEHSLINTGDKKLCYFEFVLWKTFKS